MIAQHALVQSGDGPDASPRSLSNRKGLTPLVKFGMITRVQVDINTPAASATITFMRGEPISADDAASAVAASVWDHPD